MNVVGHQDIGMHCARFTAGDVAQILQVSHIVDFCEEAGTTVVAALDDMLGNARQIESGLSGHRSSMAAGSAARQRRSSRSAVRIGRLVLWEVNLTPFAYRLPDPVCLERFLTSMAILRNDRRG